DIDIAGKGCSERGDPGADSAAQLRRGIRCAIGPFDLRVVHVAGDVDLGAGLPDLQHTRAELPGIRRQWGCNRSGHCSFFQTLRRRRRVVQRGSYPGRTVDASARVTSTGLAVIGRSPNATRTSVK